MKTQMKFQKKLCLAMLILGALTVVLALLYCTGALAAFGSTIDKSTSKGYFAADDFEAGGQLYLDVQSFNNLLLYFGVILVLAAVVLYIMGNQSRRNYYLSNHIASLVVALIFIVISIIILVNNASYFSRAQEILKDTDTMDYLYELSVEFPGKIFYSESSAMFIFAYVLCIVNILASIVLVLNSVWKYKLMKGEKALLEQGAVKEVA